MDQRYLRKSLPQTRLFFPNPLPNIDLICTEKLSSDKYPTISLGNPLQSLTILRVRKSFLTSYPKSSLLPFKVTATCSVSRGHREQWICIFFITPVLYLKTVLKHLLNRLFSRL